MSCDTSHAQPVWLKCLASVSSRGVTSSSRWTARLWTPTSAVARRLYPNTPRRTQPPVHKTSMRQVAVIARKGQHDAARRYCTHTDFTLRMVENWPSSFKGSNIWGWLCSAKSLNECSTTAATSISHCSRTWEGCKPEKICMPETNRKYFQPKSALIPRAGWRSWECYAQRWLVLHMSQSCARQCRDSAPWCCQCSGDSLLREAKGRLGD